MGCTAYVFIHYVLVQSESYKSVLRKLAGRPLGVTRRKVQAVPHPGTNHSIVEAMAKTAPI
jgi:hypothetical protein